ncbi:MAG: homocysteine S-methyltransferase family protein [Lachnospiraceae bacterium]|nr:homocysteine S-methyltransferase family protein [Lachnospiraceae bacterium]
MSNYPEILILDGAMGTELQAAGLPLGGIPEVWNIEHPEKVTEIHRRYIEAGSQVVYANTFGANRLKMAKTGYPLQALIVAAIGNARAAVLQSGKAAKVALDIGPIGRLLSPLGDLSFEEAYDIFAEEVRAAKGADMIVIETMSDLYEAKAAVLAAKENSDLPVFLTMSFEANGRTFTGTDIDAMALTFTDMGIDGIGVNCSLGPAELLPMVKRLYTATKLPIVVKPNAGLPDPATNTYNVSAEEFAGIMRQMLPFGVRVVGGCCGTSPAYIKELTRVVREWEAERDAIEAASDKKADGSGFYPEDYEELTKERNTRPTGICSANKAVWFTEPRCIGERINPTGKKRFKEALQNGDMDYILGQAISQVEAGAEILDVNVGLPGIDETEMMVRVIRELQAVVDVPLQIDSNKPEVLEAALRIYNGKPLVNSVNGEEKSLSSILPLVKKYGAAVVGLTLDEAGIGSKAEERFAVAEKIVTRAESVGIRRDNLQIDCLTLTASAEQAAVAETLKAVAMVHERLHTGAVLGVSNVSFGLPNRDLVNATFLTMALQNGLTLPIMNPNSEAMMGALRAFRLLMNIDKNSLAYMDAYRDYVPPTAAAAGTAGAAGAGAAGAGAGTAGAATNASAKSAIAAPSGDTQAAEIAAKLGDGAASLYTAVVRGLTAQGTELTKGLLTTMDSMDIVNGVLIPALDTVGAGFETGKVFLPQLILSASVVQGAFAEIKEHMRRSGGETVSKGTIVLATVKGDIHDIGKNIVKVLLENYGFTVVDLGRDVEISAVVEAARKTGTPLVGLSALMTTTLPSMKDTIAALREARLPCKVVVGGAVLTPDYAAEIGADYYGRDAKATVDIAREVFGV